MRSSLSPSNQITRGIVAAACALAFSLGLAAVWGTLTEVTLPTLYDAAQTDPDGWLTYGFWSMVRLSLPLWATALWMTAIGSFFDSGPLYRFVRGTIWLIPAALCATALLVQGDVGGIGTSLMIAQGPFEHLASAEIILP